jgi:DNA-binding Lrp family transcriptional regulator
VGRPKVKVDEVDFRILRELFAGETDSFRSDRATADAIARRLRLHRNTVSSRLRKLTTGQAFLPLTLEIDPGRFGMVGGRVFLDVPVEARTAETRAALFNLEGVFGILAYHDGYDLVMYAEDEASLASKAAVAKRLTGASLIDWELRTDRDYPPDEPIQLSRLDARLIAALLRNARDSFGNLSKELGTTSRTLERRYRRLQAEKVITMLPGGSADIEGMVMAYVSAEVREEGRERTRILQRIMELLPNHYIRNVATRGKLHFFLYGTSLAELEAQAMELRKITGVRGVTFRIFLGPYPNPRYRDWLARVLERRATAA